MSVCRFLLFFFFFFSSRRRHTRLQGDWSSDVCSSDLVPSPDGSCPCRTRRSTPPVRSARCQTSRKSCLGFARRWGNPSTNNVCCQWHCHPQRLSIFSCSRGCPIL